MSGPTSMPEPNIDPAAADARLGQIAAGENAMAAKTEKDLATKAELTTIGGFLAKIGLSAAGAIVPEVPALAPFSPEIAVALAAAGEALDASLAAQKVTVPPEAVAQVANLASQRAGAAVAPALASLLGGSAAGDAAAQAATPALTNLATKEAGAAVKAIADEIQKQS